LCSSDDYYDLEKPCEIPTIYDFSFGTIGGNCSVPKKGRGIIRFSFEERKFFEIIKKKVHIIERSQDVLSADESFLK
jgi:hypothetical protein